MDCGWITEPEKPRTLCGTVMGRRRVAYLCCTTTANAHRLVLSMLALACGGQTLGLVQGIAIRHCCESSAEMKVLFTHLNRPCGLLCDGSASRLLDLHRRIHDYSAIQH